MIVRTARGAHLAALALAACAVCGCGGLAANRTTDAGVDAKTEADVATVEAGAGADAAPEAGPPVHCGGAPDYFPDGAPPWVTCSCPDAGCPAQSVCAWYLVPEGPRVPFGCGPLPSSCAGHATCACAGALCGTGPCLDEEAGLLCN